MAGRRRKGKDMRVWSEGNGRLLLRGLHEPFVLLGAHAVLGKGAPLDARCPHGPGIDMAALLAPAILRFRGAYL